MAVTYLGPVKWSCTRDEEGQREYKLVSKVKGLTSDGPQQVLECPGLPQYGDPWVIGNDVDEWAFCKWDATITPHAEGEPNTHFLVEQTFSSKPTESKSCHESPATDPLLEPAKISGGFQKYTEEAAEDQFGAPILNSAHEQIRGPQVEFDRNRPTVKIEQNLPSLSFGLQCALIDCVNDSVLWNIPERCIKLSSVQWERKFYGSCNIYYTRTCEFDINIDTFDRLILDEGTKVLHGEWNAETGDWDTIQINGEDPDPYNPAHFDKFVDRKGDPCKVVLNGAGLPAAKNAPGSSWVDNVAIPSGPNPPGSDTSGGIVVPTGLAGKVVRPKLPTDPSFVEGTVLRYVITAKNETGETLPSAEISVTINSDGSTVQLTWNSSPGASGYLIYRNATTGPLVFVKELGTGSSDPPEPGTVYVSKYPNANLLLLGIPTIF